MEGVENLGQDDLVGWLRTAAMPSLGAPSTQILRGRQRQRPGVAAARALCTARSLPLLAPKARFQVTNQKYRRCACGAEMGAGMGPVGQRGCIACKSTKVNGSVSVQSPLCHSGAARWRAGWGAGQGCRHCDAKRRNGQRISGSGFGGAWAASVPCGVHITRCPVQQRCHCAAHVRRHGALPPGARTPPGQTSAVQPPNPTTRQKFSPTSFRGRRDGYRGLLLDKGLAGGLARVGLLAGAGGALRAAWHASRAATKMWLRVWWLAMAGCSRV